MGLAVRPEDNPPRLLVVVVREKVQTIGIPS